MNRHLEELAKVRTMPRPWPMLRLRSPDWPPPEGLLGHHASDADQPGTRFQVKCPLQGGVTFDGCQRASSRCRCDVPASEVLSIVWYAQLPPTDVASHHDHGLLLGSSIYGRPHSQRLASSLGIDHMGPNLCPLISPIASSCLIRVALTPASAASSLAVYACLSLGAGGSPICCGLSCR